RQSARVIERCRHNPFDHISNYRDPGGVEAVFSQALGDKVVEDTPRVLGEIQSLKERVQALADSHAARQGEDRPGSRRLGLPRTRAGEGIVIGQLGASVRGEGRKTGDPPWAMDGARKAACGEHWCSG